MNVRAAEVRRLLRLALFPSAFGQPRVRSRPSRYLLGPSSKLLTAEKVGEVPPTSFRRRLLLIEEILAIVCAARTRRFIVDAVCKEEEN